MLPNEREQLKVGQQIFYRDYHCPIKTPKIPATVVSQSKYSTSIKYIKEFPIKFPKEKAGGVSRVEMCPDAIASELFFSDDDSDWCDYRDYTLCLYPYANVYSVKIFVKNHQAAHLCDFEPENRHSYSLEEAKKYVDISLFKTPTPLPLQQEIITGCSWWIDYLTNSSRKMPDDGFERSPDETMLTLNLLNNVPLPQAEAINTFGENLLKALNQSVVFLKELELILAVDNLGDLCPLLGDAASDLIDEYSFPAKTTMRIEQGDVVVSLGYGARFENLPLSQ